jgi:ribosomal protein L37AE/L43A
VDKPYKLECPFCGEIRLQIFDDNSWECFACDTRGEDATRIKADMAVGRIVRRG